MCGFDAVSYSTQNSRVQTCIRSAACAIAFPHCRAVRRTLRSQRSEHAMRAHAAGGDLFPDLLAAELANTEDADDVLWATPKPQPCRGRVQPANSASPRAARRSSLRARFSASPLHERPSFMTRRSLPPQITDPDAPSRDDTPNLSGRRAKIQSVVESNISPRQLASTLAAVGRNRTPLLSPEAADLESGTPQPMDTSAQQKSPRRVAYESPMRAVNLRKLEPNVADTTEYYGEVDDIATTQNEPVMPTVSPLRTSSPRARPRLVSPVRHTPSPTPETLPFPLEQRLSTDAPTRFSDRPTARLGTPSPASSAFPRRRDSFETLTSMRSPDRATAELLAPQANPQVVVSQATPIRVGRSRSMQQIQAPDTPNSQDTRGLFRRNSRTPQLDNVPISTVRSPRPRLSLRRSTVSRQSSQGGETPSGVLSPPVMRARTSRDFQRTADPPRTPLMSRSSLGGSRLTVPESPKITGMMNLHRTPSVVGASSVPPSPYASDSPNARRTTSLRRGVATPQSHRLSLQRTPDMRLTGDVSPSPRRFSSFRLQSSRSVDVATLTGTNSLRQLTVVKPFALTSVAKAEEAKAKKKQQIEEEDEKFILKRRFKARPMPAFYNRR